MNDQCVYIIKHHMYGGIYKHWMSKKERSRVKLQKKLHEQSCGGDN